MSDVYRQADAVLRRAGYSTASATTELGDLVRFEDDAVLGFLRVFPTAQDLVTRWRSAERADLAESASRLRAAPIKAWNVYSVFLALAPASPEDAREIDRIEEDFTSTRKIARAGIAALPDIERALLPILPLATLTSFSVSDYESRLRTRLGFLAQDALETLLGDADPKEIARILLERR
jgi:hypothetical protein